MADNKLDISSTAAEKAIDMVSGFLKSIVKEPLQELGGMLTDRIRVHRAFLQAKNVAKVKDKCEKAGINPKQLNMKVLVPYLDAAALEEDEILQEVWANLLTNYLDPNKTLNTTVYPSILKDLSSIEVKVLEYLFKYEKEMIRLSDQVDFPQKVTTEIASNLERIGLIKEEMLFSEGYAVKKGDRYDITPDKILGTRRYVMTNFGREFVKACTRDGQ
ncbi:Abi-alpha family protein [Edaphocola flava]|uniref:Abi-alpha family protein n=1 Tax=Edaphocola flava TaxID=2499629 RepID=UPI00100AC602|nr:Abi-alpha family protein [Edaphocola flava]